MVCANVSDRNRVRADVTGPTRGTSPTMHRRFSEGVLPMPRRFTLRSGATLVAAAMLMMLFVSLRAQQPPAQPAAQPPAQPAAQPPARGAAPATPAGRGAAPAAPPAKPLVP